MRRTTLALPIAGAALLCDAPQEVEQGLAEATRHLGVLYQIQDDLVDLWGEKGRDQRGNDIREGKPSALVVHCLKHCSAARATWLLEILAKPRELTTFEEVSAVIELFERLGSLDFALAEVHRLTLSARSIPALADQAGLRRIIEEMATLFLAPLSKLMVTR